MIKPRFQPTHGTYSTGNTLGPAYKPRESRDVLATLDSLGAPYQVRGDEAHAPCPAHDDTHPSWSINISTGVHHCFACGFSGTLRSLVAFLAPGPETFANQFPRAGSSFREPGHANSGHHSHVAGLPDFSWKYTEAALAMFTEPPPKMLSARGLTAAACRRYQILWNQEKESWVCPIRERESDKLLGWQEKNERCFRNRPRGVGKSETLFGLGLAAHGSRTILVESPLDAARLESAGIRGGLAAYGVHVSTQQFSALLDIEGPVVLALDDDPAGVRATRELLGRVPPSRFRVFDYGRPSRGKDPGELTDEQVRWGVEHALSARMWYLEHRPGH